MNQYFPNPPGEANGEPPGRGFLVRLNFGVGFALTLAPSGASPPLLGVEKDDDDDDGVASEGVPERGGLVSLSLGVDGASCPPSDGRVDD